MYLQQKILNVNEVWKRVNQEIREAFTSFPPTERKKKKKEKKERNARQNRHNRSSKSKARSHAPLAEGRGIRRLRTCSNGQCDLMG